MNLTHNSPSVLNVLAGRSVGVVRGTIRVNGLEPDAEFYRTTGYVEQFDLHGASVPCRACRKMVTDEVPAHR